jgi:predicted PurR-regulated permease PerM
VGLIDNLARPFLLKGGMALHGGIVFFSLLGGLAVFGGVGLVVGPLVVTFLVTVLNMYQREFALEARDEEGAGAPTPPGDGGALERRPPAEPRPPP